MTPTSIFQPLLFHGRSWKNGQVGRPSDKLKGSNQIKLTDLANKLRGELQEAGSESRQTLRTTLEYNKPQLDQARPRRVQLGMIRTEGSAGPAVPDPGWGRRT